MLICVNRDPSCLQLDYISGYILNVPSDYRLGFVLLPLRRRHWVAVRQVAGTYYNFDSKLETPLLIGQVRYVILRHCHWKLLSCGIVGCRSVVFGSHSCGMVCSIIVLSQPFDNFVFISIYAYCLSLLFVQPLLGCPRLKAL